METGLFLSIRIDSHCLWEVMQLYDLIHCILHHNMTHKVIKTTADQESYVTSKQASLQQCNR